MESNTEKLQNLLIDSGVGHKLDGRITPTKHPAIAGLVKNLRSKAKKETVEFTVHTDRDSLIVSHVSSIGYFEDFALAVVAQYFGLQIVVTMRTSMGQQLMSDTIVKITNFFEEVIFDDGFTITVIYIE